VGDIIIDANTGVHAKQLSAEAAGAHPIAVIELLCVQGARLVLTDKVRGEQTAGSMRELHDRWLESAWMRTEVVSANLVKELRNKVGNTRPIPNAPDIALVALAERCRGVFYSHDGPARAWAHQRKLVVVDVVDLAGYVIRSGLAQADAVERGHAGMERRSGLPKPADWQGSIAKTLARRTGSTTLFANLDRTLGWAWPDP